MRTFLRRALVALGAAAGLLVATVGGTWWGIEGDGNVHVVAPGVLVRSAQPTAARLDEVARRDGIRSVLNLRGPNPGQPWYDEELAASARLGLRHVDIALSAQHDLSPDRIDGVLATLDALPRPVLVHCNAGADRTGLVVSAWLLRHGAPAPVAERQLALRYGHFPWLGSKTAAMDRSLAAYERRGPAASSKAASAAAP